MPLQGPGLRHIVVATKACDHGQIVVEENFVGVAFKQKQLGPYVDPAGVGAASPKRIAVGEEFAIQLMGLIETPLTGAIAGLARGAGVWVAEADNTLQIAAAAGREFVGVISSIDTSRTPSVARINTNVRIPAA